MNKSTNKMVAPGAKEAIERINAESGKITYMHTTEIPKFRSFGVGLGYSEVELTTVIIYGTD